MRIKRPKFFTLIKVSMFFRVKSCIDGKPLDGVYSIRVHNGVDYSGKSRFIRWTEVFVIQVC